MFLTRIVEIFFVHKYRPFSIASSPTDNQQFVLTSDRKKIDIYFHKGDNQRGPCPTIVIFHSNNSTIASELKSVGTQLINTINADIVIYDPRGCGRSMGIPTRSGMKMDVEAVMNFISSHSSEPNNVIFYGRSLGCSIALDSYSTYRDRVKLIILENPFTSITNVVPGFLQGWTNGVTDTMWNNEQYMDVIDCFVLLVQSLRDTVVPPSHTEALYNKVTHMRTRMLTFDNNHLESGSNLTFIHFIAKCIADEVYSDRE